MDQLISPECPPVNKIAFDQGNVEISKLVEEAQHGSLDRQNHTHEARSLMALLSKGPG